MKDNIEIRFATDDDLQDIIDLWRYAFSDTEEFIDYYFEHRYNPNHTMLLLNKNRLEAALQLNPYNLAIGDIISPVSYIVGVSVQPESRGLGYMTDLIKATLQMQYDRGEDFSILMPIDTRIYTRYGYANCFMRHEFHVDLARLQPKRSPYKIRRIDLEGVKNMDQELHMLSELYYDAVNTNYSFVSRNKTYWKEKFAELGTDGGQVFLICDDFSLKGYAMLIPKSEDGTLNVIEMMALNKQAFDSIMGLVKAHSTQADRAILVTPQAEEFLLYTHYDNMIEHQVKPFMMGRVINVEIILDRIIYKSEVWKDEDLFEENDYFCISISDNMIEENNYTAIYKKGLLDMVTKEKCDSCLPDRRLKMTVAQLTQLYLKSTNISTLHKMGKIELLEKDLDLFEKIFGKEIKRNYINEFI